MVDIVISRPVQKCLYVLTIEEVTISKHTRRTKAENLADTMVAT